MGQRWQDRRSTPPSLAARWYADTAVFGGYNSYDTRRSAVVGEARGDTDGGELGVLFGTGYDFKAGALTFGPTATFNYTYTGMNGFTEHGSLAPLDVHGGKGESLRSAFGLRASYECKMRRQCVNQARVRAALNMMPVTPSTTSARTSPMARVIRSSSTGHKSAATARCSARVSPSSSMSAARLTSITTANSVAKTTSRPAVTGGVRYVQAVSCTGEAPAPL